MIGKLGPDEGKRCGAPPGEGQDLGGTAAGTDIEGTAPDELPPRPAEESRHADEPALGGMRKKPSPT
jgi:hypothetical protein